MNFDRINLFDLASKRLEWVAQRQRTTAENIANADVANYRAKEVESFDSYLERAKGASELPAPEIVKTPDTWGASPSGNSVVLEEQLLEASSANGQYRMATNLYRKAYEMVATVVSSR